MTTHEGAVGFRAGAARFSAGAARFRMISALMRIDLIKYQALGNDYLVLDLPGPLGEVVPLLPMLCDRHRGLGSDGLLSYDPAEMAVRIFNPHTPEAQTSGDRRPTPPARPAP